jgi:hypothetical protein
MQPFDYLVIGYGISTWGAIVWARTRPPTLHHVALCRLGDARRPGGRRPSEDGIDGLRYASTGAHAPRFIFQRQWVRSTNAEDDQIYVYFAVATMELATRFRAARTVILGVEYFDLDHPTRNGKGFYVEYDSLTGPHKPTTVERFSCSNRWRTAYFNLPNLDPNKRLPAGGRPFADLRIIDSTPEDARQPFELRAAASKDLVVRRVFMVAAPEA